MQAVFRTVAQAAAGRTSVLLTGEPGTGKALIAAAIHEKSPRARAPFVRLSCRGHAESALDGELFGQEHGAGGRRRDGRLEQAQGGTLFLEEIDALPVALQVKLRRFLEGGRFERAGGDQPIAADVRVIASSGRDLPQLVADGQLREDLFQAARRRSHRDAGVARSAVRRAAAGACISCRSSPRRTARPSPGSTKRRSSGWVGYVWPGNVRELEDTIERAVSGCRGPRITAADLPPNAAHRHRRRGGPDPRLHARRDRALRHHCARWKRPAARPSRAAEILGISIRKVQYKLQEYQSASPNADPSKGSEPPAMGKRN